MWKDTREKALAAIRDHVKTLRDEGKSEIAEALEYVFFKVPRCCDYEHFAVQGAGEIEVGRGQSRTGTAVGAHFGVSWGVWGYAGGVMDAAEIYRLIDHLQSVVGDRPVDAARIFLED